MCLASLYPVRAKGPQRGAMLHLRSGKTWCGGPTPPPWPASLCWVIRPVAPRPPAPHAPTGKRGSAQEPQGKRGSTVINIHVAELLFLLSLSSEAGCGQPVRESDSEASIVYASASFGLTGSAALRKAAQQEEKEGRLRWKPFR